MILACGIYLLIAKILDNKGVTKREERLYDLGCIVGIITTFLVGLGLFLIR